MRDYYYVIKFREWEHDGGYSYLAKDPVVVSRHNSHEVACRKALKIEEQAHVEGYTIAVAGMCRENWFDPCMVWGWNPDGTQYVDYMPLGRKYPVPPWPGAVALKKHPREVL